MGPPGEIRGGFSLANSGVDFSRLFVAFAQPILRLCNSLFFFCPQLDGQSLIIQPRLVRSLGVPLNLFMGLVAGLSFDVFIARTSISQPETGFPASLAKPVRHALGSERLAMWCQQECEIGFGHAA
jgi:hypothetical protein